MSGMLSEKNIRDLMKGDAPLITDCIDFDTQLQPNGVDMTLKAVMTIEGAGRIDFDNSERKISEHSELAFDDGGYIHLSPGTYSVKFNEVVHMPKDIAALGKTRSSLLRCGACLQTAVWDAGYSGRSESMLIVTNPLGIDLRKNAKIMQLIFFRLESEGEKLYSGIYQNENV
ncbi:MAG: deoxyuridine 5'-triphosphate nucleotidohydrolase [Dehalococcoidales bacterium]|nr:deoxyuridine 5'-triphosphate nucleotidohydrolase [Dehalococcoidales bacterium]